MPGVDLSLIALAIMRTLQTSSQRTTQKSKNSNIAELVLGICEHLDAGQMIMRHLRSGAAREHQLCLQHLHDLPPHAAPHPN